MEKLQLSPKVSEHYSSLTQYNYKRMAISIIRKGSSIFFIIFTSVQNVLFLHIPSLPKKAYEKKEQNEDFAEIISGIFEFWKKRTLALEPLPPAYVLYARDNDEKRMTPNCWYENDN